MKRMIISSLGLKGSWKWAIRQMKKDCIIYLKDATGTVRYRFSRDGQFRIQWTFDGNDNFTPDWSNAYIFLSDLQENKWAMWFPPPLENN